MDLRLQDGSEVHGIWKHHGLYGKYKHLGEMKPLSDGSEVHEIWNHHGLYGKYKHLLDVRSGHFQTPSRIVWKIHASGRLRPLPGGAEDEKKTEVTRGSDVICKSVRFA